MVQGIDPDVVGVRVELLRVHVVEYICADCRQNNQNYKHDLIGVAERKSFVELGSFENMYRT